MLTEVQKLAIRSRVDKRTIEKQADAFLQVLLGVGLKDILGDPELQSFLSQRVKWSCE